jgi:anti-sigma regulatory factor (Ser/Thr protein kinase)
MGINGQRVTDVQLAVNEAIGNAVVHAYRDSAEPGAFALEAHQNDQGLEVVVRDQGCGEPNRASTGAGLGLPLIRSIADDVSVEHRPGQGTEVVMRFRLPT